MASSSSSSSPSYPVVRPSRNDIFLSFRGPDTRETFTRGLIDALNQRQGLLTVWYDKKLEKGEEIHSQLLTAIEESRVSIVVFSEDYAASRWCLDELVKIMECRRDFNQIVLPIFYYINPSDVRRQNGPYAKAFEEHENRYQGSSWKEALTEASNLSGWHLQNVVGGDEAKIIINSVVEDVIYILDPVYLNVTDHPVGINKRAQELKAELKLESEEVRIVAIWGVGGIGKTTIAKSVFNSIHNKFEGCSFLADVRVTSKTTRGVVALQKQLLSNILRNETHNLEHSDEGIEVIRRKLSQRRVLLVLDDVDHVEQLENLGISHHLLCKGSKIIITTRNLSSVTPLEVEYSVYKPVGLNYCESLKLFSLKAFKTDHPEEDYLELSNKVVAYAAGLPLALEVLGSFFCGRDKSVWNDGLEKFKKYPHGDIQGKLIISFESLEKNVQEVFLDIAFFFSGMDKYFTIKVLEDSECFPTIGIDELARRCLVRVDEHKQLRMHNLLRDMAREIVRQKSFKEPGKRSRLRGHKEVLDVLRACTGKKAIEGLYLELDEINDEHVNAGAFGKMRNLRLLLHLNYLCHLQGTYVTTTRKLKWLCWHRFPLPCLPADLHMENLVAIDLQYSKLKQIWKGPKRLDKLRFLNLSHSRYLTKTPDFSGLKSLERLLLHDCENLVQVHNSIGCLDKLLILNLATCRNLRNIPSSIYMLTSLQYLNLSGYSRLNEQAGTGCKRPLSMLRQLFSTQPQEYCIPGSYSLASIQRLSCLRMLTLAECNMSYIPSEIGNLKLLLDLDLKGNNFCTLPSSFSNLSNLQFLSVSGCLRLKSLPDLPNNLSFLGASNCKSLEPTSVGSQLGKAKWMNFDNCTKFNDKNFRRNILQLYEGHSEVAVYLPGSKVPSDFQFQGIGSGLSFTVPPGRIEKILGWIVCAVVRNPNFIDIRQEVINNTKVTTSYHPRLLPHGQPEVLIMQGPQDIMWLNYVSVSRDGFNLEGGDEVDLRFFCYGSHLFQTECREIRCGMSLIYEGDGKDLSELNEEANDPGQILMQQNASISTLNGLSV